MAFFKFPTVTPLVAPQVVTPSVVTTPMTSTFLSPIGRTPQQKAQAFFAGTRPAPRFRSPEDKAIWEKQQASIALGAVASPYSPVQNAINKILGATPDQPITIPVQLPPVTIEAAPATQQAMFTNIALLGAVGIGIALILRR